MTEQFTTLQLLLCVALAGVAGGLVGRWTTPPSTLPCDHGNPLRKAINAALLRGYQADLVQGWGLRADWCRSKRSTDIERVLHQLRLHDANVLSELVGRGYSTEAGHMRDLGWLAHSIGFDVRKYEGV